jgi:hypothetical protein
MNNEQKTLREWMLTRHAEAEPRLDALRRSILAPVADAPGSEPSTAGRLRLLTEIIGPGRIFWKGLGLAWVAIVLMYLTVGRPDPVNHMPAQTPSVALWLGQLSPNENFLDTLP